MKQFLKILLAAGVIAFAASMLAVSCGKTADPGGNNSANNSGNNNSGGSGGSGGSGNSGPPAITIGNFVATAAKLGTKVDGNDRILINASQFPTGFALGLAGTEVDVISLQTSRTTRVFDLTITGGATGTAIGGMMIVDIGSRAKFADIAMTTAPSVTTGAGTGVVYNIIKDAPAAFEIVDTGLNIFGIFIDRTVPTSNNPNTAPFSFSHTGGSGLDPQPIFFCHSAISPIITTTPAVTTELTGGQTANCYVAGANAAFTGTGVTTWFTALANNANLKKRFYFTVAGMRTDSKPLSEVFKSLTGANDAAKVGEFMNGLTTAEMEIIRKDNITAFKKIMVEIVPAASF